MLSEALRFDTGTPSVCVTDLAGLHSLFCKRGFILPASFWEQYNNACESERQILFPRKLLKWLQLDLIKNKK